MPRVVGVDPSAKATGIASSDGWVEQINQAKILTLPWPERVDALDGLAVEILAKTRGADLVVVEEPLPGTSQRGNTHVGGVIERNWLFVMLVRYFVRNEQPFAIVHNKHRAMYATGNGNATKTAVVEAVADFWPDFDIGKSDNKADAVTLMALGAHALAKAGHGAPLGEVPKLNQRAIERVEWPIEEVKARLAGARRSLPKVCMIPDCGCSGRAHP